MRSKVGQEKFKVGQNISINYFGEEGEITEVLVEELYKVRITSVGTHYGRIFTFAENELEEREV